VSRSALLPLSLVVLLLVIAFRALASWAPGSSGFSPIDSWFFDATATFPQVVFALAAFLLFRRRRRLRAAARGPGAPGRGAAVLASGTALFLWAQYAAAPDLQVMALALLVLGGALWASGPELARALLVPMALLLFAIPLPGAPANHLVYAVQIATARYAAALLELFGIPVLVRGEVLVLPHRRIEVIETCGGLRAMEILTLLAVFPISLLPTSRAHAALLIASAPGIAFLLNGARVLGLVRNPDSEVFAIHTVQGAGMFLAGGAAIAGLAPARRSAPEPGAPARRHCAGGGRRLGRGAHVDPHGTRGGARRSLALDADAGATSRRAGAARPPSAARHVDRASALEPDRSFLGSVHFTRYSSVAYERGDEVVHVFAGYDDRELRTASLLSAKNEVPGSGWSVEERGRLEMGPAGPLLDSLLARSSSGAVLSAFAYRGVEGVASESVRALLALDRSPLARSAGAHFVRLSTPLAQTPGDRRRAETRLREVWSRLEPSLAW
jgi:exosortase